MVELSFRQRNLLRNFASLIDWIVRDESQHLKFGINLILTVLEENPEIATDEFAAEIQGMIIDAVAMEEEYNSDLLPMSTQGGPLLTVPGVHVDHRVGGRLVASHLLGLGHTSFAMVDGRMPGKPTPWSGSNVPGGSWAGSRPRASTRWRSVSSDPVTVTPPTERAFPQPLPPVHAWEASRYTLRGIYGLVSARRDGKRLRSTTSMMIRRDRGRWGGNAAGAGGRQP